MQADSVERAPGAYRVLTEQIRAADLLERQPWRYGARLVLTVGGFAAGWAALLVLGDSWASLGVGAFLALAATQVLFIGHDAGHQQIFASRRANWLVGLLVGNVLTGLSFGWWVPKHNAHHTYPNQVGRDPDIGPSALPTAPVEATTSRQGGTRWVVAFRRDVLAVPLVLLEVGMHLSSGKTLALRRDRAAALEWLLLAGHAALYLTAVLCVLSPLRAAAFIAVQQGLFGLYLRLSFAPNHKGMPIIEADAKVAFVERQVLTARNVTGGRLTTFLLGGLNYQIEHHLFPMMPRANLPRAQCLVRAFCLEHGLDYREDRLLDSYRQAIRFLTARTAPLSVPVAPPVALSVEISAGPGR